MPRDLPTRRVFVSIFFAENMSLSPGHTLYRSYHSVLLRMVSDPEVEEVETLYHAVFLRWALPRCSCPTPFADVWDIEHVPCLAPFVVRVETLAFIRNKK